MGNDVIKRPDWGDGGRRDVEHYVGRGTLSHGFGPTPSDAAFSEKRSGRAVATTDPSVPTTNLQRALAQAWQNDPAGYSRNIKVATSQIWGGLMKAVDEKTGQAVADSFDALPLGVQTHIVSELARDPARATKRASPQQRRDFENDPVGQELIAFWKGQADAKIDMLYSRLDRMVAGASKSETLTAIQWYENLPDRARMAVTALLAK